MSEPVVPAAVEPSGETAAPVVPAAAEPVAAVVPAVPVAAPLAVAPSVPETYTLALPEKSLLDPKAIERISGVAKALKLSSNDDAQAVLTAVDAEVAETLKVMEAANAVGGTLYAARVKEMETAALKHPELGAGDPRKLKDAQLRGQLVLNKYGPELLPLLEKSGDGSRPELLLLLSRIAAATGEAKLVVPSAPGHRAPELTSAQKMYPELYADKSATT